MRKLINGFINFLTICHICHGMGVTEKPNGDTMKCPACDGKGNL